MSNVKNDVAMAIYDLFCSLEQDIVTEHTFKALLAEVIAEQRDSYTILLRLWEEHRYITVLRQPGKPRAIELGAGFERNYGCLM